MNVALTRARHALYVFGHMDTLKVVCSFLNVSSKQNNWCADKNIGIEIRHCRNEGKPRPS